MDKVGTKGSSAFNSDCLSFSWDLVYERLYNKLVIIHILNLIWYATYVWVELGIFQYLGIVYGVASPELIYKRKHEKWM